MRGQRTIIEKIIDQGGDYYFGLKVALLYEFDSRRGKEVPMPCTVIGGVENKLH
jgi:hypothetical protein